MKATQKFIQLSLVTAVLAGGGCNAKSDSQSSLSSSALQPDSQSAAPRQSADIQVRALGPEEAPDEAALRQLVGNKTLGSSVQLANYPELPVSDRILAGLEAAGRVLTTADGKNITWGFKYKEANLQSVVIADSVGRPELAAVVDDIPHLNNGDITSLDANRKALQHRVLHPRVVIFARDRASLIAAYPLLKRWLAASLLGFNTSCAEHAAACALIPQLDLPTDAYVASGSGSAPTKVAVPEAPAALIPLEKFTQ